MVFQLVEYPLAKSLHTKWLQHWYTKQDILILSSGKRGSMYLLHFPEVADFLISMKMQRIQCYPARGVPRKTIRHLLLDQVVPRILGQLGRLVLHGAAVTFADGKSVVFSGESGQGKSTIAAYMHTHGAQLLSDDCLVLEMEGSTVLGVANYHGVRLEVDSAARLFDSNTTSTTVTHYSKKRRIIMDGETTPIASAKRKIDALFFLEKVEKKSQQKNPIAISPIAGVDRMVKIFKQLFVLDSTKNGQRAACFANVSRIAKADFAIYRLRYAPEYSTLPAIMSAVCEILQQERQGEVSNNFPQGVKR